ncbi:MAG: hypothetical protein H7831_09930 [Magnetococcus sp. WYHC-3]
METKPNNYDNNIRLERKFADIIKQILGRQFIGQDPVMDREQATDFLVLNVKPFKVACRLRTLRYYDFRDQFTIRWKLSSGGQTEIDKIRAGFGDYIFYGFVNKEENKIIDYFIGDLNVFRQHESTIVPGIFSNCDDNPSMLAAYNIASFPMEFIIKRFSPLTRELK